MLEKKTPPPREEYHIKVKGNLDPKWEDYFDGFIITQQMDDVTLLTGMIVDQAALHGILIKIRDLGLPLLYVERKEGEMTR